MTFVGKLSRFLAIFDQLLKNWLFPFLEILVKINLKMYFHMYFDRIASSSKHIPTFLIILAYRVIRLCKVTPENTYISAQAKTVDRFTSNHSLSIDCIVCLEAKFDSRKISFQKIIKSSNRPKVADNWLLKATYRVICWFSVDF